MWEMVPVYFIPLMPIQRSALAWDMHVSRFFMSTHILQGAAFIETCGTNVNSCVFHFIPNEDTDRGVNGRRPLLAIYR
jgi:hypothetical protein